MEEARFCWLWRFKIFRKFLGQAVVVFVRWEGKEKAPHRRRFPVQLASPSCLFRRSSGFFLQAKLCLGERPRWTWREAEAGGLSGQRRVLVMLLIWSLLVPPSLSHPIPELVGGGLGEGGGRGQGLARRCERSHGLCRSEILYLGSPQRSRSGNKNWWAFSLKLK